MSSVPEDLRYTKDHEWVQPNAAVVVVGITEYAQRQLGDIVYVELPNVGDRFEATEPFGSVESVKAVSELYTPVTGEVVKINEELSESPELLNDDPYGEGWLIEIRMTDTTQTTGLLTSAEYTDYIRHEADS